MKLFNNHLYVILHIKQKEKAEVVKLASDHNLDLTYPDMFFKEVGGLSQICIDDGHLGGHLMSMICFYEINYLRNKNYRLFKDVKELKKYVRIADQRQEHYFIAEKSTERYYDYVKSLSLDALRDEYFLVKNVVGYINSYYLVTKNNIEKTTGIARHDLISALIINMFNWTNLFGAQIHLVSDVPSVIDSDYSCRTLVFEQETDNNLAKTKNGVTSMLRDIYATESQN